MGHAQTSRPREPVAPSDAAVAAGAVKGPVLFLKISIAPAAVKVWKEEEGKRGVGDQISQSVSGTRSSEDKLHYLLTRAAFNYL